MPEPLDPQNAATTPGSAYSVAIDDFLVQTRAVLRDAHGPLRIAITGLSDGPVVGAVMPAQITKRISGHSDCIATLESGSEAHLSARRGGQQSGLTQGARFMAQVVRAGEEDKLPEIRRVDDMTEPTPHWDEIDEFLAALPADFAEPINIATPQLWNSRVPAWQRQFKSLANAFVQDFQTPGKTWADYGAVDALQALLAQNWPLKGGGNICFGAVSGITVFDINSGAATGQKGALQINFAAAKTLPRLIALGELGGLMVVDFIDLKRHTDQRAVLDTFDAACAASDIALKRTGWSKFGLVELQMQKTGRDLSAQLTSDEGAGYHAPRIVLLALAQALTVKPEPMSLTVGEQVYHWLVKHEGAEALSQRLSIPIKLICEQVLPSGAWSLERAT